MMCYLLKNTLPLFLVILKLCTETYVILKLCTETYGENHTSGITLTDLSLICGITDGKSEVKTIPPECTAIAQYTNDIDRLRRVYGMKGPLRFMIIVDTVDYNEKEDRENLENFLKDPNTKFDLLVLDLHKLADFTGDEGPVEFTHKYVQLIRDLSHGAGIGLLLHTDLDSLKGKVDVGTFNDIADFFLFQSTGYTDCKYETYQSNMEELAPVNSIKDNIKYLESQKLDTCRLIYTIDLKIESRLTFSSEEMGYSYMCNNKLSVERRYCYQSEVCLFNKFSCLARIRPEFNLTGIFIMGIEYDDVDGTCGCTTKTDLDPKFRGLRTIAGASKETKNSYEAYKCNLGAYPSGIDPNDF